MTSAAPDTPISASQTHTKYEIDETLHGEARRKALKAASKAAAKARKRTAAQGEGDNSKAGTEEGEEDQATGGAGQKE